jgi:D-lyxose ketol-isomerase
MKRSEINAQICQAIDFLAEHQYLLPPFATWMPEEWQRAGTECREIVECSLGWDITDFGSGDFASVGLLLITLRNGRKDQPGKTYAEKIMVVREGQVTPTHFHSDKMEDIINRGGGNLMIRLWNATPDDGLSDEPVTVSVDGVLRTVEAGGIVRLTPGESICLTQRLYHRFWGEDGAGTVLVGEVSSVNDDTCDNRFYDEVGRFPAIEEDEAPLRLLCNEYLRFAPSLVPS